MKKEIISFEKFDLPITIHHLHLTEGSNNRGVHSHKAIEIVAVKRGTLNCHINEEVIPVHPKEIIFINSNNGHVLSSADAEISYIHFDVSLLKDVPADDRHTLLHTFISHTNAKPYAVYHDNEEIKQIFQKINAKYDGADKENGWYLKAYLYELVAFMYAQRFIFPLAIPKERLEKIGPIVDYIDRNFKTHITLDDICAAVQYNKYTICHTFKSVTGSTILDYINFLRVHSSIAELRETGKSILEIAIDCGFSSAIYFNRVFKTFYGCSPSVYRKLLTKK